jgi:hypothetical protein
VGQHIKEEMKMITENSTYANDRCVHDYIGLSTDEKPLVCANASTFYEMDTKKLFMFDAQNKVWLEQ